MPPSTRRSAIDTSSQAPNIQTPNANAYLAGGYNNNDLSSHVGSFIDVQYEALVAAASLRPEQYRARRPDGNPRDSYVRRDPSLSSAHHHELYSTPRMRNVTPLPEKLARKLLKASLHEDRVAETKDWKNTVKEARVKPQLPSAQSQRPLSPDLQDDAGGRSRSNVGGNLHLPPLSHHWNQKRSVSPPAAMHKSYAPFSQLKSHAEKPGLKASSKPSPKPGHGPDLEPELKSEFKAGCRSDAKTAAAQTQPQSASHQPPPFLPPVRSQSDTKIVQLRSKSGEISFVELPNKAPSDANVLSQDTIKPASATRKSSHSPRSMTSRERSPGLHKRSRDEPFRPRADGGPDGEKFHARAETVSSATTTTTPPTQRSHSSASVRATSSATTTSIDHFSSTNVQRTQLGPRPAGYEDPARSSHRESERVSAWHQDRTSSRHELSAAAKGRDHHSRAASSDKASPRRDVSQPSRTERTASSDTNLPSRSLHTSSSHCKQEVAIIDPDVLSSGYFSSSRSSILGPQHHPSSSRQSTTESSTFSLRTPSRTGRQSASDDLDRNHSNYSSSSHPPSLRVHRSPHHRSYSDIHAGKGWISPHPLSVSTLSTAPSVAAGDGGGNGRPQSIITLPSSRYGPHATLTYAEWKAWQERGLEVEREEEEGERRKKGKGKERANEREGGPAMLRWDEGGMSKRNGSGADYDRKRYSRRDDVWREVGAGVTRGA